MASLRPPEILKDSNVSMIIPQKVSDPDNKTTDSVTRRSHRNHGRMRVHPFLGDGVTSAKRHWDWPGTISQGGLAPLKGVNGGVRQKIGESVRLRIDWRYIAWNC